MINIHKPKAGMFNLFWGWAPKNSPCLSIVVAVLKWANHLCMWDFRVHFAANPPQEYRHFLDSPTQINSKMANLDSWGHHIVKTLKKESLCPRFLRISKKTNYFNDSTFIEYHLFHLFAWNRVPKKKVHHSPEIFQNNNNANYQIVQYNIH